MMTSRLRQAALVLLFLASAAATATTSEDWESGKQAYAARDYQTALVFFESARDQGLGGPAVHYNIAVCQFKLEHYQAAAETFALIAERFPRMRGLAEYNLGLISSRLEDPKTAEAHFREAYALSADNRTLRNLAARQMRELDPVQRSAAAWTGAIGLRGGYDDNVALRDETGLPSQLAAESPMSDLFATIRYPAMRNGGPGVEASAYLLRYFDVDEFDQSQLRGTVYYGWRGADWRLRLGAHASAGGLGGESFDRKAGAHSHLARSLGRSAALELRYSYDDVSEGDSSFAAIAGSRQQVDARLRWYAGSHRIQLRYWFETNDRQDPAVSPDRHRVVAGYRYQPETGIGYEAGIDFRTSEYDDISTPRQEDLVTLRTALTYMLPEKWLLMMEYLQAENDSTDAAFSYDRKQVTLGVMKLF